MRGTDKHTVVYIEWTDSAMHNGWQSGDSEYKIAKCCSAGIFVEKTKEAVVIALSSSLDGESYPYAEVLAIPVCNIISMVEIEKIQPKGA